MELPLLHVLLEDRPGSTRHYPSALRGRCPLILEKRTSVASRLSGTERRAGCQPVCCTAVLLDPKDPRGSLCFADTEGRAFSRPCCRGLDEREGGFSAPRGSLPSGVSVAGLGSCGGNLSPRPPQPVEGQPVELRSGPGADSPRRVLPRRRSRQGRASAGLNPDSAIHQCLTLDAARCDISL